MFHHFKNKQFGSSYQNLIVLIKIEQAIFVPISKSNVPQYT